MEKNDIYYYCSKKVKFLKRDIFTYVLNIFKEKNVTCLDFENIYTFLQDTLHISTVNRANLRELLKPSKSNIVFLKTVQGEAVPYITSEEQKATSISEQYLTRLKNIIVDYGLDYVISILKLDGTIINNVCELLQFKDEPIFNAQSLRKKQRLMAEFLSSFEENELLTLFDDEKTFNGLYSLFLAEIKRKEDENNYLTYARDLLCDIHTDNFKLRLKYLVNIDINKILLSMGMFTVRDLLNLTDEQIIVIYHSGISKVFLTTLSKLRFSLALALRQDFYNAMLFKTRSGKPSSEWKKYLAIINKRVAGETLQSVANDFGMTRERVRQIENKSEKQFRYFYMGANGSLSRIIHSFAENQNYITLQEITDIFAEYSNIFVYFLKQYEEDDMNYVSELDIFAYHEILNWYEEVLKIANTLPETITTIKMKEVAMKTTNMFNDLDMEIPYNYIEALLSADYTLNGSIYSRSKLRLSSKYEIILKKYFSDGISLYKEEDMSRFRDCYTKTFSDADKLPKNDRAIYSRISSIAILCGRGKYKPKTDHLISPQLLKDICDYLDSSDKDIFLTNTLFYVFEDRLIAESIDNKYYLQGVLREKTNNKYFFSRDYISKSKELTSVYPLIIKFIEDAKGPITKAELCKEFLGVPDVVISLATQNENIIVGYNVFVHKNFIISQVENIELLKKIIINLTADGEIHHSDELMSILSLMHPQLLADLKIDHRYLLFSVVEALFNNDFSISRPFFAQKRIVIGKQEERMRDYLSDKDEVEISDFMGYVKDNMFIVNSILNQLNEFNNEFLIVDKNRIMRIMSTGMNKYKMDYVEEFIDDIIGDDELVVIDGKNFSLLPKINIQWTSWLVYSVINKWSKRYKVTVTNKKFRQAKPIVFKANIEATDMESLLDYIKDIHNFDETQMTKYMFIKGLA